MLKNYWLIAIRKLWKHKAHAIINILGLTIGLASCLIIFLSGGASPAGPAPVLDRVPPLALVAALGAALVPVLFAYGGWQTAGFVRLAGDIDVNHVEHEGVRQITFDESVQHLG